MTDKNGYGFPKENVFVLLNEDAGTEQFKRYFKEKLISQARRDDVVVFFFAGHGSQAQDQNGDEVDGWDETLLFHDARTAQVSDLLDDELNRMLSGLYAKTKNIIVILDSCNSGTAIRAPESGTVSARYVEPAKQAADAPRMAEHRGDGDAEWAPAGMPGTVVFTAASDGNPALEKHGYGIFTDALIQVLASVGQTPLTYAQVARQVPPLVAAGSYQVPYFHGDLTRTVFGNETRKRPIGWEIVSTGPPVELAGPPLLGFGKGAELRVYGGNVTGGDTRDPGKAKATLVLSKVTGLNGTARVIAKRAEAAELVPGDLAVLLRPADELIKVRVRLRPESEPGGLSAEQAAALEDAIRNDREASLLVDLVSESFDFELTSREPGALELRDSQEMIRNTFQDRRDVPSTLWRHARQRALLHLSGEGGSDFRDGHTLKVRLVEAPQSKQNKCADGVWNQAAPNSDQIIPLCHAWNLQVTLSQDSPKPLLIGALILSSDGSIFALPADDRKVRLNPGEKVIFNDRRETFRGEPPLRSKDRVLVFGTQETNPVQWSLFTETSQTRAGMAIESALGRALHRYLIPGERGQALVDETVEDTTWTLSSVAMQVEANPDFVEVEPGTGKPIGRREYTISDFDIRPYLPDDETSPLYKVLRKAHALANASRRDGYGYKQHSWSRPTDRENLELGIDCSRAVWFAFTRAGIPYNREDEYLTTAQMVTTHTWMKDQFESCNEDPRLRLGDVLVYRDDTRGDGHVVMVIDPEKRYAWGSHGWDGNPRILPVEPDNGVEYQLIKFKPDWMRWDRPTMELKACWRHRSFIEETTGFRGLRGLKSIKDVCNPQKGCGSLSLP